MATFHELVDFFKGEKALEVEHTDGSYLGHCAAVYRDMKRWGADEELAQAGFFHSVYGTGLFQKFKLELDRRDEIRALTGERAERLAYLNCAVVYDSFDEEVMRGTPPFRMEDRFTGDVIDVSEEDFNELVFLQLCDRLEQIPRSKKYSFRQPAFEKMAAWLAERTHGAAPEAYERVYSQAEVHGD